MTTIQNCTFIGTNGSTIPQNTWTNIATHNTSTTSTGATSISASSIYYINTSGSIIDINVKALLPGSIHKLPDGSKLSIDFNGNYEIIDNNAKVTYSANNIREFNEYINTSDLLEKFIKELGVLGVKQKDVLNTSIELFINWLIINAAKKDGDKVPQEVPKLENSMNTLPKCKYCNKLLTKWHRKKKVEFCNGTHLDRYLHKITL